VSRSGRALSPVPIVQEAGWASELVWTQRLEEKSLEQTVKMLKGTRGAPPRLNEYVVVEWLTLLPCSNLGPDTGYLRFIVVAICSQANSSTVPEIRPRVLPSKSSPIHPSRGILLFDAI
jgi:hypothetical protein